MSFSKQVKQYANGAQKHVEAVQVALLLKLLGKIIEDTPVDSGRLRGNWTLTKGATPKEGTFTASGAKQRITKGVIQQQVTKLKGDIKVVFHNNLPYARRIEYEGYSKTKAPQGMLRKNVTLFERLLKEAQKENNG